jgi:putative aldouronate transport system permease protein
MGAFFLSVCALCLAPAVHLLAVSLSGKNAVLSGRIGFIPVGFTLDAYRRALADGGFIYSFGYSLALTSGYTLLALILTSLCAYPLAQRDLPGARIVKALVVFTIYFTPGIIPSYLNARNLGLLDSVWALALPGALSAYNAVILINFFRSVDPALFEAARIDGAGEYLTLAAVAVPLAAPALATIALFYAVSRWNGVSDVLFYVTNPRLYTVQLKLKQMTDMVVISQQEGSGAGNDLAADNIKAAAVLFSMLPIAILYPFIQRRFTRGILLGAVKG